MKKLWITCCLLLICAAPLTATSTKTMGDQISAEGIDTLKLEAGVGDVEIIAVKGETIGFEVVLEPRRGGLFTSKRRAEREVEEATLEADISGSKLYLKVRSSSSERRFEETWTIELPARLAADIEHGVGDIGVRGITGGVELETGVGDVRVSVDTGDVMIEIGVGDAEVEAPVEAYGSAKCSAGVGNARLRVDGEKIGDGGFLGNSTSWSGSGEFEIRVDVGVGNAEVTLE